VNDERAKRKLSAILSADVKGYSRLMGEDELSTIETLKKYRKLISSIVVQYRGRVVDSPGDNLLAEFGSAVDAVECSVKIQKELKKENKELQENQRMEFRIGVNLGDVVEDDDRIYGDGVNIAARIEGLADSGGICISRTAYDQVKNKLSIGYEYLGEHSVKNIPEPVRVYRILTEPEAAGKVIGEKRFLGKISRRAATVTIIILVIVAAGLIGWNIYLHQSRKVEAASLDRMAYPLPVKPSIAVLPFDNLSGDPDQEYFSDGLTEEIITGLSKIPELFVIARNSTFTYKGKPVKIQQVSEELGVRYVLEGSVRKEGKRVRITAQLIDAIKGYHIWSERYDRDLKDILALQDEIMKNILVELGVKLIHGEEIRYWLKDRSPENINLKWWETRLLLEWYWNKKTPEGWEKARQLANDLVELDPNNADSYFWVAVFPFADVLFGKSKSPKESMQLAEKYARKAIQMDESHSASRSNLGWIYIFKRQHDLAIEEMEKRVALEPNGADAHFNLGIGLHLSGRNEEAIQHIETAIRLDPYPRSEYYSWLGSAYGRAFANGAKDPDKAIELCKKALEINPNDLIAHVLLTLIYSERNQMKEARFHASESLRIRPPSSFSPLSLFKDIELRKYEFPLLRKAGLPE